MTSQEKTFIEHCLKGDLKYVQTCVEYGVDVNVENSWGINCACRQGHTNIVFYLLENGVSLEQASNAEVLEYAAHNGFVALVAYLIKDNDIFKNNNRAVQWAAMKGYKDIVEMLLTYADNINGTLVSAAKNGHMEIVQMLIDNDLAEKDLSRETVIYKTAKNGHWKVVELLLNSNIGAITSLDEKQLDKYNNWKAKQVN